MSHDLRESEETGQLNGYFVASLDHTVCLQLSYLYFCRDYTNSTNLRAILRLPDDRHAQISDSFYVTSLQMASLSLPCYVRLASCMQYYFLLCHVHTAKIDSAYLRYDDPSIMETYYQVTTLIKACSRLSNNG